MIEAELDDGTILEFPDGTDEAVIQRAVKRELGLAGPGPAPSELRSLGQAAVTAAQNVGRFALKNVGQVARTILGSTPLGGAARALTPPTRPEPSLSERIVAQQADLEPMPPAPATPAPVVRLPMGPPAPPPAPRMAQPSGSITASPESLPGTPRRLAAELYSGLRGAEAGAREALGFDAEEARAKAAQAAGVARNIAETRSNVPLAGGLSARLTERNLSDLASTGVSTVAPLVVGAVAGPTVGLATMFPQAFGSAYLRAREEGYAVDDALKFGLGTAAAEIGSEVLPMAKIAGLSGRSMVNAFKGNSKALGEVVGKMAGVQVAEANSEALSALGEFVTRRALDHPEATVENLARDAAQQWWAAMLTPAGGAALIRPAAQAVGEAVAPRAAAMREIASLIENAQMPGPREPTIGAENVSRAFPPQAEPPFIPPYPRIEALAETPEDPIMAALRQAEQVMAAEQPYPPITMREEAPAEAPMIPGTEAATPRPPAESATQIELPEASAEPNAPETAAPPVRGLERLRADPGLAAAMTGMARAAGGEEAGGRHGDGMAGRTAWVPREAWFARMRRDMEASGLANERQIQAAVQKAIAGQRLGARERRTVEWMLAELEQIEAAPAVTQEATGVQLDPFAADDALRDVGLARQAMPELGLMAEALARNPRAAEAVALAFQEGDNLHAALREIIETGDWSGAFQSEAAPRGREAVPGEDGGAPADFLAEAPEDADLGGPDLFGEEPRQAPRAEIERAKREAAKRKAQEQAPAVGDFRLTGSDRPADQAAAAGQQELVEHVGPRADADLLGGPLFAEGDGNLTSGSRAIRRLTKAQQANIDFLRARAREGGAPAALLEAPAEWGKHGEGRSTSAGLYNYLTGIASMREELLGRVTESERTTRYATGIVVHESAHALDDLGGGRFVSSTSERLAFENAIPKGDLAQEASRAFERARGSDAVGFWFKYPFGYLGLWSDALMQMELWAQLVGFYHYDRAAMQRELPIAYNAVKDLYAALETTTTDGQARAALRATLRSSNPPGAFQGRGSVGPGVSGSVGSAGEPGAPRGPPGARVGELRGARGDVGGAPASRVDAQAVELGAAPLPPEYGRAKAAFLAGAPVEPRKGRPTHVNYGTINSTEDVKRALALTSEAYEQEIQAQRRGAVPWAQTYAEAVRQYGDVSGLGPEEIKRRMGRQAGTPAGAAELAARREILTREAERLDALIGPVADGRATEQQAAAFLEQTERVALVLTYYLGARAEVGRAMNILRNMDRLGLRPATEAVERAAAPPPSRPSAAPIAPPRPAGEAGGAKPSTSPPAARQPAGASPGAAPAKPAAGLTTIEQLRELERILQSYGGKGKVVELAQALRAIREARPGQVGPLAAAARKAVEPGVWDALVEVWKAGLLWMPWTHAVNVASNLTFAALRVPETQLAALLSLALPGPRQSQAEAAAMAAGAVMGTIRGLKAFGTAALTGETPQKAETHQSAFKGETFGLSGAPAKAVDIAGDVLRGSFRALGAEDAFFRVLAEEMTRYQLAVERARREGKKPGGPGFWARVTDFAQHPTPDMAKRMAEEGDRFTFNRELGEKGRAFQTFVRRVHLEPVVPFIRTPGNIFKEAFRRTPIAPAVAEWRADIRAGGERRNQALAEMMLGSALAAFGALLASAGVLTGGGDPERGRKAVDRAAGWQPYSINVDAFERLLAGEKPDPRPGDRYFEYRRLEPIATPLMMAADGVEFRAYMSKEDRDKWARMVGFAFAQNVTNKTMLRGMTDLVNVVSDPERYGENYFEGWAGSIVPGFVGAPALLQDDTMRETTGMAEAIQSRIPRTPLTPEFNRQGLPPKVDVFGKPVPAQERALGFSQRSERSTDPVRAEAARLRLSLNLPAKRVDDVRLPPAEYAAYAKRVGEISHQVLERLVNSPGYERLNDAQRAQAFKMVFDEVRALERERLKVSPELGGARGAAERALKREGIAR
jgi:hypothetical protein